MIGSLLATIGLSLCGAIPSLSSEFGSPNRAISDVSAFIGTYSFDMTPNSGGTVYFDVGVDTPVLGPMQAQVDIGSWKYVSSNSNLRVTAQFTEPSDPIYSTYYKAELGVEFRCGASFRSDMYALLNSGSYSQGWGKQNSDSTNGVQSVFTGYISKEIGHLSTFEFTLTEPPINYSVIANYVYCSHTVQSGEKYLPSSYTSDSLSNPYVFRVDASEGCRFRKDGSAVSTTGGITINTILYDGLPASVGSDYATWIAIELNLPLADCSITFNAINQFAVTKNLDACTTTIPDVYSVGLTGTYRIEAVSGYAFDSQLTQYSTTGIVVNSVSYADNIYGALYRTIVLDLSFPATNYASVTCTATPYSADYAQGYNDGKDEGLSIKGGLMDLIPNVFASIGAFFFTFSGVNFMGINLLAVVGIVVSVGLIGVVIKVALK